MADTAEQLKEQLAALGNFTQEFDGDDVAYGMIEDGIRNWGKIERGFAKYASERFPKLFTQSELDVFKTGNVEKIDAIFTVDKLAKIKDTILATDNFNLKVFEAYQSAENLKGQLGSTAAAALTALGYTGLYTDKVDGISVKKAVNVDKLKVALEEQIGKIPAAETVDKAKALEAVKKIIGGTSVSAPERLDAIRQVKAIFPGNTLRGAYDVKIFYGDLTNDNKKALTEIVDRLNVTSRPITSLADKTQLYDRIKALHTNVADPAVTVADREQMIADVRSMYGDQYSVAELETLFNDKNDGSSDEKLGEIEARLHIAKERINPDAVNKTQLLSLLKKYDDPASRSALSLAERDTMALQIEALYPGQYRYLSFYDNDVERDEQASLTEIISDLTVETTPVTAASVNKTALDGTIGKFLDPATRQDMSRTDIALMGREIQALYGLDYNVPGLVDNNLDVTEEASLREIRQRLALEYQNVDVSKINKQELLTKLSAFREDPSSAVAIDRTKMMVEVAALYPGETDRNTFDKVLGNTDKTKLDNVITKLAVELVPPTPVRSGPDDPSKVQPAPGGTTSTATSTPAAVADIDKTQLWLKVEDLKDATRRAGMDSVTKDTIASEITALYGVDYDVAGLVQRGDAAPLSEIQERLIKESNGIDPANVDKASLVQTLGKFVHHSGVDASGKSILSGSERTDMMLSVHAVLGESEYPRDLFNRNITDADRDKILEALDKLPGLGQASATAQASTSPASTGSATGAPTPLTPPGGQTTPPVSSGGQTTSSAPPKPATSAPAPGAQASAGDSVIPPTRKEPELPRAIREFSVEVGSNIDKAENSIQILYDGNGKPPEKGMTRHIKAVAALMSVDDGIKVKIRSHAMSGSGEAQSEAQALARAENIKNVLVEAGIAPDRLEVSSIGQKELTEDSQHKHFVSIEFPKDKITPADIEKAFSFLNYPEVSIQEQAAKIKEAKVVPTAKTPAAAHTTVVSSKFDWQTAEAQALLYALGHLKEAEADGIRGKHTNGALASYYKAKDPSIDPAKLSMDKIVSDLKHDVAAKKTDPAVHAKIKAIMDEPQNSKIGDDAARTVQIALNVMGYRDGQKDTLKVTGVVDNDTRGAYARYEQALGTEFNKKAGPGKVAPPAPAAAPPPTPVASGLGSEIRTSNDKTFGEWVKTLKESGLSQSQIQSKGVLALVAADDGMLTNKKIVLMRLDKENNLIVNEVKPGSDVHNAYIHPALREQIKVDAEAQARRGQATGSQFIVPIGDIEFKAQVNTKEGLVGGYDTKVLGAAKGAEDYSTLRKPELENDFPGDRPGFGH